MERLKGRIEINAYAVGSKSAREHQAFLVTADGERLLLRRYDGPTMRDAVLEAMDGKEVVAEGMRRDRVFIAKQVRAAVAEVTAPASGTALSTSGGRATRTR